MADFPQSVQGMAVGTNSYISSHSLGHGEATLNAGLAGGSSTWPAANRIIYVPFYVGQDVLAQQMDCYNGTVVAGNIDLGIYTWGGTRLVSLGATAQAGTSVPQVANITDTALSMGWYYMGLSCTSTTSTFFRTAGSNLMLQAHGVRQEAGAGSLPSTATFANPASAYLPVFGVHFRPTAI